MTENRKLTGLAAAPAASMDAGALTYVVLSSGESRKATLGEFATAIRAVGSVLPITHGGTGASSAGAARTLLGLAIGTDVQPSSAGLTAIAALAPLNDDVIQRKAGAWTSRAPAQLKADMGLSNIDNTGATFSGLVSVNGGLKFPASQAASSDANTLDDYEEGTFTPSLLFGGGATGMTYGSRAGRYVKIGALVLAEVFINLSAKGSSTGVATITGLPFSMNSYTVATGKPWIGPPGTSPVSGDVSLVRVASGSSIIQLIKENAGAGVGMTDESFSNNTMFNITISYSINF